MASNKTGHKSMSYSKYGYLFVAPFVIVYCIFSLYPLLNTFWFSTAKMDASIADFWGFGNKDVYYDRYLNLIDRYGDDFEKATGIKKKEYNKIKYYFEVQKAADKSDPLNKDGMQAIINLGANEFIHDTTIKALNDAVANSDMSYITDDVAKELKAWNTDFGKRNAESDITSKIKSFSNEIATKTVVETSDDATTTEAITADTIKDSADFQAFIDTLKAGEFDENQTALINYLAEKTGKATLAEYFEAVLAGETTVEDPMFYYVVTTLSAPNAVYTDAEGNVADIEGIKVPFQADLEKYLQANAWSDTVSGVSSVSKFDGYADGSIALHTDEEQLYADLVTLDGMGLIKAQLLEVKDGKIVASEEKSAKNILAVYRNYIDTKAETNPNESAASRHIFLVLDYCNTQSRTKLLDAGLKVDSYVTYNGKLDINKYKEFKKLVALDTVLTLDFYEQLDATRKAENKAKAEAKLTEYEAALPEAKAALDAAEAKYDGIERDAEGKPTELYKEYSAAKNAYAEVVSGITNSKDDIKNPKGILYKVDSSKEYIFVGLDNFSQIFGNRNRMNVVMGTFVTTFVMWIIGFIPQIVLALILSAWFTDTKLHLKGLNAMKAMMYLPNVITAVTIAIFFRRVFAYSSGGSLSAAQQVRQLFGAEPFNYFGDPWATRFLVCFINFWMWYGNTMIVLIAGITSINESIYESAQLDGANSFQTYTKITLPLLRPMLLYTFVTSMIGGLQMYDIPFNLNMNPAVINFNGTYIMSSQTVLMYINDQAFGKQSVKQVGIAAAVSVILFVVTTILSIIIFYLMRDKDAAKAKKMKKGGKK